MSDTKIIKKSYSLSQIMASISSVISKTYSKPYWIKAEMIKLNFYNKSGHCYPDLAEKEGSRIKSQIRATLWSGTYFRINADFVKATGRPLSDGMNILFLAQVKHDALHGLTLNILDIDTDFELGQMAKSKLECVSRLKEENVFFMNRRLAFPLLPKRIAVISVETSKGYQDFINILNNNSRSYSFFTMLFPALLQGDAAVNSIIGQLENIKRVHHHFDIVAIIRGGGGDVGLACYDNYDLAREVATFPIPVVSGIGHSTNETVVEMVANYNPITPTDLAYFLQQKFDNLAVELQQIQNSLIDVSNDLIESENDKIASFNRFVVSNAKEVVRNQNFKIESFAQKINFRANNILRKNAHKIISAVFKIRMLLKQKLKIEKSYLNQLSSNQLNNTNRIIVNNKIILEHLEDKIELLKPENLLRKGYSLSFVNGKPINDISSIKKGDKLLTRIFNGEIESEITKIINND